jgi:hypothetical protein
MPPRSSSLPWGFVPEGGIPTKDIGNPDLEYGTWGQGLLTEWLPRYGGKPPPT